MKSIKVTDVKLQFLFAIKRKYQTLMSSVMWLHFRRNGPVWSRVLSSSVIAVLIDNPV